MKNTKLALACWHRCTCVSFVSLHLLAHSIRLPRITAKPIMKPNRITPSCLCRLHDCPVPPWYRISHKRRRNKCRTSQTPVSPCLCPDTRHTSRACCHAFSKVTRPYFDSAGSNYPVVHCFARSLSALPLLWRTRRRTTVVCAAAAALCHGHDIWSVF